MLRCVCKNFAVFYSFLQTFRVMGEVELSTLWGIFVYRRKSFPREHLTVMPPQLNPVRAQVVVMILQTPVTMLLQLVMSLMTLLSNLLGVRGSLMSLLKQSSLRYWDSVQLFILLKITWGPQFFGQCSLISLFPYALTLQLITEWRHEWQWRGQASSQKN